MSEDDIYKALGDPIRLEMVRRLARGSDCSIGELSAELGISRQGARKQLQVLVDAKVVRLAPRGRSTMVELELRTLVKARLFILELERQWDQRLNALKKHLES